MGAAGAAALLGCRAGTRARGRGPSAGARRARRPGGRLEQQGAQGHLGALARGEVTTGAVKILGLGVTGLVAAALVDRDARAAATPGPGGRPGAVDTLVGGAVIAGSANLLNLLDLRPGRALKATILLGALTADRRRGSAAGRRCRGRCRRRPARARPGRARPCSATPAPTAPAPCSEPPSCSAPAAAAGGSRWPPSTALTLASEKVSFTRVIESTPGLRELDALGRRTRCVAVRVADDREVGRHLGRQGRGRHRRRDPAGPAGGLRAHPGLLAQRRRGRGRRRLPDRQHAPNVVYEVAAGGALAAVAVPAHRRAARRRTPRGRRPHRLGAADLGRRRAGAAVGAAGAGGSVAERRCCSATSHGARRPPSSAPRCCWSSRRRWRSTASGIVLAGVLQAHRRFLAAALAPLLSSLVVIGAYLGYRLVAEPAHQPRRHLRPARPGCWPAAPPSAWSC